MIVVSRRVKPGREKEYSDWLHRIIGSAGKFPGYRGVTTLAPEGSDGDLRYLVWRFEDQKHLENWEKSEERAKFMDEVENYAEEHQEKASGMETLFKLPDIGKAPPPPKWKMFFVVFFAAYVTSFLARMILASTLDAWPLFAATLIYTTILVVVLTYIALPGLGRMLRRWLTGKSSANKTEH